MCCTAKQRKAGRGNKMSHLYQALQQGYGAHPTVQMAATLPFLQSCG
jgi:hypothetical protein